MKPSTFSNWFR